MPTARRWTTWGLTTGLGAALFATLGACGTRDEREGVAAALEIDDAAADGAETDDADGGDGGDGEAPRDGGPSLAASAVVIAQIFAGGGETGAPFDRDYVVLFNRSEQAMPLYGMSLQYADGAQDFGAPESDGGPSTRRFAFPRDASVGPGRYVLVAFGPAGEEGAPLPAPDFEAAFALEEHGKVALARGATSLRCGGETRCPRARLFDLVGYGDASDFEGAGPTAALGASVAAVRGAQGCADSEDNAADFRLDTPSPWNGSTASHACSAAIGTDASGPPLEEHEAKDASADAAERDDERAPTEPAPNAPSKRNDAQDERPATSWVESSGCAVTTPGSAPLSSVAWFGLGAAWLLVGARRRARK